MNRYFHNTYSAAEAWSVLSALPLKDHLIWSKLSGEQQAMYRQNYPAWCPKLNLSLDSLVDCEVAVQVEGLYVHHGVIKPGPETGTWYLHGQFLISANEIISIDGRNILIRQFRG